jgi:nicotinate-nucleotide adenylyltransferase
MSRITLSKRIGMFGGSFDPIHHGHLISAHIIAEQLSLDRVVLIPCGIPPHKPGVRLTEPRHRLEMIRLALGDDPLFEIDDLEVHRSGPSYTIDTVDVYRAAVDSETKLFWIVGADSLLELHTWHRIVELVQRVQIVAAVRPGCELPKLQTLADAVGGPIAGELLKFALTTPQIEISASDIRKRVQDGRSIRFLVPESVRSYIYARGIYQVNP